MLYCGGESIHVQYRYSTVYSPGESPGPVYPTHLTASGPGRSSFKLTMRVLAAAPDQNNADVNKQASLAMEKKLGQVLWTVDGGPRLQQLAEGYDMSKVHCIPDDILREHLEVRRAFAAGLLDALGYLRTQRNPRFSRQLFFDSALPQLLPGIQQLFRSVGCGTSEVTNHQGRFQLSIHKNKELLFIRPVLEHKRLNERDIPQLPAHSRIHVTRAPDSEYRAIVLRPNNGTQPHAVLTNNIAYQCNLLT
jgi:hypothetical protein